MSRLTSPTYLVNRQRLASCWAQHQHGWSNLSFEDQCTLHDYYQPSMDLTDDQAIGYRQAVTEKWPSLPHRAGKAYAAYTKVIAQLEAAPPKPQTMPRRKHTQKPYVIHTEALVRPDVDFDKLARVLLDIAREQAEKKDAA